MASEPSVCIKCGGELESGFLLDRSVFAHGPLRWVEAAQLGLKVTPKAGSPGQIEVDAYRCVNCGFLELYAGLSND